eukprot:m.419051 g.419051  ORF g.419051 m.419051 type:complete len:260 (-) comp21298_c0_seq6:143-922(-)
MHTFVHALLAFINLSFLHGCGMGMRGCGMGMRGRGVGMRGCGVGMRGRGVGCVGVASRVQYGLNGQVAENHALACGWWQQAAALDFAPAMYNLGIMYIKGRGVDVDVSEAMKLFTRANLLNPRLRIPHIPAASSEKVEKGAADTSHVVSFTPLKRATTTSNASGADAREASGSTQLKVPSSAELKHTVRTVVTPGDTTSTGDNTHSTPSSQGSDLAATTDARDNEPKGEGSHGASGKLLVATVVVGVLCAVAILRRNTK